MVGHFDEGVNWALVWPFFIAFAAVTSPFLRCAALLPDTLGLGPEVWRVLSRCRDMRNRTEEEEGALDVVERLVIDLIGACRKVPRRSQRFQRFRRSPGRYHAHAERKSGNKKAKQATHGQNGGIFSLTKQLFQAALRDSARGRHPIMMFIQSCP